MGNKEPGPDSIEGPSEPGHMARPTRIRYQVLGSVCVLALIAYVHRVGFASAGLDLKRDLHLTERDWGTVMAVFLVAYGALEIPWGVLGDWMGVRHILTIMTLGWSLLTAALALLVFIPGGISGKYFAFTYAFLGLLVLRFLFGAFQAGAFPAISRMMADWMPVSERATAQGLIWTFSRLGGAVAPFLVGMLAIVGNWQWTVVLLSVLGFVWCAGFWPWFRNRPEQMKQVNAAECRIIVTGRAPAAGHGRIPWSRLVQSRSVWCLCFMYGFGGFSATFFITMLPSYLQSHRHFTNDEISWLSGMPLACGIVACLGGGMVSDAIIRRTGHRKWGRRICGMIGHSCAGFLILATIWIEDRVVLGMVLSATFFCNDLSMGPAWAACADIGERYAGTVGGAMNMIGNLMAALGSQVAGHLLHEGLDSSLFVVFACSFWLASLCWFGVDATRGLQR